MGQKACNFIKKRLQHRCFPVNIVEFLRTLILKNIYEWLLLNPPLLLLGLCQKILTLLKKWSFPLRNSSVNVTKSSISCEFGHICRRNPWSKTSYFMQWHILSTSHFLKRRRYSGQKQILTIPDRWRVSFWNHIFLTLLLLYFLKVIFLLGFSLFKTRWKRFEVFHLVFLQ